MHIICRNHWKTCLFSSGVLEKPTLTTRTTDPGSSTAWRRNWNECRAFKISQQRVMNHEAGYRAWMLIKREDQWEKQCWKQPEPDQPPSGSPGGKCLIGNEAGNQGVNPLRWDVKCLSLSARTSRCVSEGSPKLVEVNLSWMWIRSEEPENKPELDRPLVDVWRTKTPKV